LHGPKTLFALRDDGVLPPALQLHTTQALPTHQMIGEAQ